MESPEDSLPFWVDNFQIARKKASSGRVGSVRFGSGRFGSVRFGVKILI
jgi:hypothetical protein